MSKEKTYQFHWIFPKEDNRTQFIEQRVISSQSEMDRWMKELEKLNKPNDAHPLICWQPSEHFITTPQKD